jgi:hypothetical protein
MGKNVSNLSDDRDVAILVISCDAYQDLWGPFFQCFFKYWPDCPYPIYLGSNFLTYADSRVRAILIGPDVDYSSNLLKMLSSIPQEWVIAWIEDRVLAAPVETTRVSALVRFAQNQRLGFLKLIASPPYAVAGDRSRGIGELPKGTRYRVCMTVALWRKETLMKLLRPGETVWDIERKGSKRSDAVDGFMALLSDARGNPPLSDMHLIIKGRLIRNALSFLNREGLYAGLQHRPLQTLRSHWYVRLYHLISHLRDHLTWRRACRHHFLAES